MIIGFGHQREVGKDTAALIMSRYLKTQRTDLEIISIGFADPLYEVCTLLYSWAGFRDKRYYDLYKDQKDIILTPIGLTPREILIQMGTPAIREQVWDNTWLQYAMNRESDITFISDVRFPNEAQAIIDKGGKLVKIERPGLPEITDPNDPDNQLADWDAWDFTIENDGTLREFSAKCMEVLKCVELK